jgi:hypothetical protein
MNQQAQAAQQPPWLSGYANQYGNLLQQAQPFQQEGLQNAAVIPDGVELDFEGDRCGKSYRIKQNCIKSWDIYFYDWHEGGWYQLRDYGVTQKRTEAIAACNQHARDYKLIDFLPTRPKFKSNWYGAIAGAVASAASAAAWI